MNKADLISALMNETDITKVEAARVVATFFNEMSDALAKDDRVEIRGLFSFMSNNTNHTPDAIQKPEKSPRSNRRSFRFLKSGRN